MAHTATQRARVGDPLGDLHGISSIKLRGMTSGVSLSTRIWDNLRLFRASSASQERARNTREWGSTDIFSTGPNRYVNTGLDRLSCRARGSILTGPSYSLHFRTTKQLCCLLMSPAW